ncbi:15767_t:CDS:1, partial [Cetraspora pellucida]
MYIDKCVTVIQVALLEYIKDQYAKIYSQEEVKIENINEITENIKKVSDQQN